MTRDLTGHVTPRVNDPMPGYDFKGRDLTGHWIARVAASHRVLTKAHFCETTVNETYTTRCGKYMERHGRGDIVANPLGVRHCLACKEKPAEIEDDGAWPQPGDLPNMAAGHEHWDE